MSIRHVCALFFAFIFFATASASSVGPEAIKGAVEELNFALNVQWDQKDPAFYQQQIEKFKGKIQLFLNAGSSMEEIIDVTVQGVKDAKLAAELRAALEVIKTGQMDITEAQRLVIDAARASGAQGAAWNGELYLWIGPVVALALVIALLSAGGDGSDNANTGGDPTGPTYQCGYNYFCSWGYDQWGHYGYNCDYVWSCGYFN